MPIYKLFEGEAFEPDHCKAMGLAFETILKELGLDENRSDQLCEVTAKHIIELGKQGVRDPVQLATLTMKALTSFELPA